MSKCNKCDLEIIWGKNQNNKTIPLNIDGTSHFEVCRSIKRGNRPFDPKLDMIIGKTIIGKDYYVCNIPEIPF